MRKMNKNLFLVKREVQKTETFEDQNEDINNKGKFDKSKSEQNSTQTEQNNV